MNRAAYQTTGLVIKALAGLSRATVRLHGAERIPQGAVVFVPNHFTRIETLLVPYHIFHLTGKPIWSLVARELFQGLPAFFLSRSGAVATDNPDRDRLIVRSLLTAEASWIVFADSPMDDTRGSQPDDTFPGRPAGSFESGISHPVSLEAATLALRAEFYRQRLREMILAAPGEARRIAEGFGLEAPEAAAGDTIWIVPVNLTAYPLRARETALGQLGRALAEDASERLVEKIMNQATALMADVDLDIRFAAPIPAARYLENETVRKDVCTPQAIDFDAPIASRPLLREAAVNIMEQCRSAVTRLTTVNHDHLFAGMLQLCPDQTMEEDDLKRRVFLAASVPDFDRMGIHRHPALLDNQVFLLTKDRQGRSADFLALAEGIGGLQRDAENRLVKTAPAAGQAPVRRHPGDTAMDLLYREIQPLHDLVRELAAIARQPAARIRQSVAAWLRERADSSYAFDWNRFAHIADRSAENVGRPLWRPGLRDRPGVLVIHGYMAAPLEVAELVEHLAAQGYSVYAPRLSGHGTAPEDLSERSCADWAASVEEGYALLANCCPRVVVGGFSTGAGLALDLAARGLEIAGVFAICPPFSLQEAASRLAPAVDVWNKLMDRVQLTAGKKEFVENHPEHPHINYKRNPIRGVRELSRLMDDLEDRLEAVVAPTLVVQSLADPVVDYRGAWRLFNRVGAADKEFFVFHFNRHGIVLGEGAERVHRAVAEFVARVGSAGYGMQGNAKDRLSGPRGADGTASEPA